MPSPGQSSSSTAAPSPLFDVPITLYCREFDITKPNELVGRYFRPAPEVDTDAYFAQFADDVTVEDEGHEYQGIDAIRAWRGEVPPVGYTVGDVVSRGGEYVAQAEIVGDFPGSPGTLAFSFTFTEGGHIQTLTIWA